MTKFDTKMTNNNDKRKKNRIRRVWSFIQKGRRFKRGIIYIAFPYTSSFYSQQWRNVDSCNLSTSIRASPDERIPSSEALLLMCMFPLKCVYAKCCRYRLFRLIRIKGPFFGIYMRTNKVVLKQIKIVPALVDKRVECEERLHTGLHVDLVYETRLF